ncbi:unnamed protein product [Ixodes persulcatus]
MAVNKVALLPGTAENCEFIFKEFMVKTLYVIFFATSSVAYQIILVVGRIPILVCNRH